MNHSYGWVPAGCIIQITVIRVGLPIRATYGAKDLGTRSLSTISFCYVGSFLCEFFLAWPDWPAPLTTSHAGLAPAFFLCTLPTLLAIGGGFPSTFPAAMVSFAPTVIL